MDESSQRKPEQDLPVNSDQEQSPLIESDAPVSSPSFSRKIIIAIGAVAILAVIGWVFIAIQQSPQTTQPVIEPSVPAATTTPELSVEEEIAFQTQADELIAAGDLTRCEEIDNGMYRAVCINNIALTQAQETGDISLCEKMDGELIPESECKSMVVAAALEDAVSPDACALLDNVDQSRACRSAFYTERAVSSLDKSVCDEISNAQYEMTCRDQVLLFMQTSELHELASLDCSVYESKPAQEDCTLFGAVTDLLENSEQLQAQEAHARIANVCIQMKTPGFQNACGLILFSPAGVE